jgi:Tol biopolymer transport system component
MRLSAARMRGAFLVLLPVLLLPAVVSAQQPEKVQPAVISLDDRNETFPAIEPRDGSLWFSAYQGQTYDTQTVMVARPDPMGGWFPAEVAPFSGEHGDRAPRFSQDGSMLVFTSNRPAPGMPDGRFLYFTSHRDGTADVWRESAPSR